MNKPVHSGLSVLYLRKTVMYDFWNDYVKPKFDENTKLFYMDTDTFIVHVKTDHIYKDIAEDVETKFDALYFELGRPLPKGQNKKVIVLMKDELGGQIMKGFVRLGAETYSYLKDNNDEDKNAKGTKKYIMKTKAKFQDYKKCLEAVQIVNKINHLEKNEINVNSIKKDKKEFIKNDKLILKVEQKFRNKKHYIFT